MEATTARQGLGSSRSALTAGSGWKRDVVSLPCLKRRLSERRDYSMDKQAARNPFTLAIGMGLLVPVVAILLDLAGVPMGWLEPWHLGLVIGINTGVAIGYQRKKVGQKQH